MPNQIKEINKNQTFICKYHEGYFSVEHFYFNKRGDYRCKELQKANVKNQKKRDKYWIRIKYTYGLTQQDHEALWIDQGKSCKICKKPGQQRDFHVDHDHSCCPTVSLNRGQPTCGKCVRGLLCAKCNRMLGQAEDNIVTLSNAIKYLEDSKGRNNE